MTTATKSIDIEFAYIDLTSCTRCRGTDESLGRALDAVRSVLSATGMTVNQWLSAERIGRAQQLLETSDMSIEQVAAEAGFGTSLSLRQHFAKQLLTSPSAYRRTFRHGRAGGENRSYRRSIR